jgi:hemerythrin-like domain-containing protein
MTTDRRVFLTSTAMSALALGCSGASRGPSQHPASDHDDKGEKEDEVTPAEDLMREHGVLRRVMYLYDDAALRLESQREVPLDALAAGAALIRHVIEDYHEKIEEQFVFPRFEKAGKLVELVTVLRKQHDVGRVITTQVIQLAKTPLAETDRVALAAALRHFNHMYRAHAAREDTVLFPAFRTLVSEHEYEELGEQFEEKEKQMIGEGGFERSVAEVAKLEKAFGLDDLALLT